MPTVRYDLSHSFGGSPAEQSKKFFHRLKANGGFILSQIHYNQAHWFESRTPCLQNRLDVIATLAGPSDFYDVVVTVSGVVSESGGRNAAIPQVTGGLNWNYYDHVARMMANDGMRAVNPPAPRTTPVSFQFAMRIPANTPTQVAATATAGAMTITNPGNNGLVNLQNLSVIEVNINVAMAWKKIWVQGVPYEIPGSEPPGLPTPSPSPGQDSSRDTEKYGYYLKPVEEDLAVVLAADPGFKAAWEGDIPEDEAGVNKMMAALKIDLAKLRKEDESKKRPQVFWRS